MGKGWILLLRLRRVITSYDHTTTDCHSDVPRLIRYYYIEWRSSAPVACFTLSHPSPAAKDGNAAISSVFGVLTIFCCRVYYTRIYHISLFIHNYNHCRVGLRRVRFSQLPKGWKSYFILKFSDFLYSYKGAE